MATSPLNSHLIWLTRHAGFPGRNLPAEAQRLLLVAVAAETENAGAPTSGARPLVGADPVSVVRQRAHVLNRSHAHFKSDNRAKV
jgi:hypothetical protein